MCVSEMRFVTMHRSSTGSVFIPTGHGRSGVLHNKSNTSDAGITPVIPKSFFFSGFSPSEKGPTTE